MNEDEIKEKVIDSTQNPDVIRLKQSIIQKYIQDKTLITFRLNNHQEYFIKGVITERGECFKPEGNEYIPFGVVITLENGERAYFSSDDIDFETLHPSSYNPIRYFVRKPISEELKNEIFKRDNFECQLKYDNCSGKAEEIDHIIPVSKGGLNNPDNLQASCSNCNKIKSNNLPI